MQLLLNRNFGGFRIYNSVLEKLGLGPSPDELRELREEGTSEERRAELDAKIQPDEVIRRSAALIALAGKEPLSGSDLGLVNVPDALAPFASVDDYDGIESLKIDWLGYFADQFTRYPQPNADQVAGWLALTQTTFPITPIPGGPRPKDEWDWFGTYEDHVDPYDEELDEDRQDLI